MVIMFRISSGKEMTQEDDVASNTNNISPCLFHWISL